MTPPNGVTTDAVVGEPRPAASVTARFSVADRGIVLDGGGAPESAAAPLEVAAGETLVVAGPNGAGKSTLLGVLAGLVRPDAGRVSIDGVPVVDAASGGASVWVPPHRRGVVLMAQQPLLFPHLTVLDNVAFGLRSAGVARGEARDRAASWLSRVDAAALAQRKPRALSGGQAQRIALARALAAEPRVLLLDEPLAAVDAALVPELRALLAAVLVDRTAIVVTHQAQDALAFGDRLAILEAGRIVQHDAVRAVLAVPATDFARTFGFGLGLGLG